MQIDYRRSIVLWCVVAVVSFAISGCGPKQAARPDRALVRGTVIYQGKPVSGGRIKFIGPSDNTATFMLREDGTFYIEDAPIGENKVTVDTESTKPELGSRYVQIPAKYLAAQTSGLTFDVKPGHNTADFDLK